MTDEFAAEAVATSVLRDLERRRAEIVATPALLAPAIEASLAAVAHAYREQELPPAYMDALIIELRATLPERWLAAARAYTERERQGFAIWRGGDPIARVTYVLTGLVLGGLMLRAPFIPIWEKWFPFALAFASYWLPDAQIAWHRRSYARALGHIAVDFAAVQPRLDRAVRPEDLYLSPPKETKHE